MTLSNESQPTLASNPPAFMPASVRVGIMNPDWTPFRHNTDHVCIMDFAHMGQWQPNMELQFLGTRMQYLKANINSVAQRLSGKRIFPSIPINATQVRSQVLYRYGAEAQGLHVKPLDHPPMLSTGGFPGLVKVLSLGKQYLKDQADHLEKSMRDAQLIHFHTDGMREQFLTVKPEQASRCITIPFFLPQLQFASNMQVLEKFDQAETMILFVGADGERKGLRELCEALDVLAEPLRNAKVQVTIVSKHQPSCHRFSSIHYERKLPRDEIQALMRRAHVFCMVPRHESFGLVFVEAMAAGCAVVADNDLPRQEIFEGGRCGLLLPANQPAAIVKALSDLLGDRAQMCKLAMAGLERASKHYAPANVSRAYMQAFSRLTA